MIHLIRFYEIQEYEEWGRNTDSFEEYSDSDNFSEKLSRSSTLLISLKVTIWSNPEIAHRALIAQLELVYDEI